MRERDMKKGETIAKLEGVEAVSSSAGGEKKKKRRDETKLGFSSWGDGLLVEHQTGMPEATVSISRIACTTIVFWLSPLLSASCETYSSIFNK